MATPRSARSAMIRWTSALAATSMPRVGSSSTRMRGLVASHFARTTFCWFPPERSLTACSRLATLMRSAFTNWSVTAILLGAGEEGAAAA